MGTTMTTIEIEQRTAEMLKAKAEASGLSLDDYLYLLAESEITPLPATLNPTEIDLILDELACGAEGILPLPENFSREDIYFNHD